MRYREILEATSANPERAAQEKRRRARERIAAADTKRAKAARRYEDDLAASQEALQKARASLAMECRSSSRATLHVVQLLEKRRAYTLRDHRGRLLGWLEPFGEILQAKDARGRLVGWYDGRSNQTRDHCGKLVGSGELLAALLMDAR
jgi:hypothetical protein